jgi:hypothetical protein
MSTAFRIVCGLTGAVIAIESLILFVGLTVLGGEANAWNSLKNNALVLMDLLVGGYLIYVAFRGDFAPALYYSVVSASLLAHGYRLWEGWADVEAPFFFNLPLMAFNGIRLVGLLASAVLAFLIQRSA